MTMTPPPCRQCAYQLRHARHDDGTINALDLVTWEPPRNLPSPTRHNPETPSEETP